MYLKLSFYRMKLGATYNSYPSQRNRSNFFESPENTTSSIDNTCSKI